MSSHHSNNRACTGISRLPERVPCSHRRQQLRSRCRSISDARGDRYASWHFNKAELNYSTIEKEAVAIIFGIKRFRHYLQDKPFVILSDHRPLQWLNTFKDETGRLGRWSIMLANTYYTVKYRPGRIRENADVF